MRSIHPPTLEQRALVLKPVWQDTTGCDVVKLKDLLQGRILEPPNRALGLASSLVMAQEFINPSLDMKK
jgi:hypothetical protein